MSLEKGTVQIHHVWKRFRADRGRRLLRDHVGRAGRRIMGKTGPSPWVWALSDIDFELKPGDAIGFVGANGAGKSTLLKIVSGVMFPHTGRVNVVGRIGALLEVSSGIHPELTGRENIGVFGSLLGLRRWEIQAKFDEIVAFSELENAIDRQVKFYSSGMKTRLGFSIAAFLEPEVLVVDEVLAVGDQLFQQKCLDRMRQVLDGGATLLLVSHDLPSVSATATRGIWLSEGKMRADGPIDDVLAAYRREIEEKSGLNAAAEGIIRATNLRTFGPDGGRVESNEELTVDFTLETHEEHEVTVYLGVSQGPATPMFVVSRVMVLDAGDTDVRVHMEHLPVPSGSFYLWIAVIDRYRYQHTGPLLPWQPLGPLLVQGNRRLDPVPRAIVRLSPIYVHADWTVDKPATAASAAS